MLACRNENRGILAANQIKVLTKNKNVYVEEVDLSDFESVKNFARNFKEKFTKLDVLINNAG